MRAKVTTSMVVSTDTDQYQILWSRTRESLNALIRDDLDVQSSGVAKLAANGGSGDSITLPMGDITTGYLLFVEVDKNCTIVLDGGAETQKIRPSGAYPGQMLIHGHFTSAPVVENQAAEICTVEYCLVGTEA
jgi:hypothetical protein